MKTRGAVRVGGLQRLRVLEGLVNQARSQQVFADHTTGASDCQAFLQRCATGKVGQTVKSLLKLPDAAFANSAATILTQAIQQRATHAPATL